MLAGLKIMRTFALAIERDAAEKKNEILVR